MARQITVDIIGNSSSLTKSFDDATSSGGKFHNVLTGIAQGIGQAAFGLVEEGISTVISKLGDASQAYQDNQAHLATLKTALTDNVKGFNGSTDAIEKAVQANTKYGVSVDDQNDALNKFVGVTHSVAEAQTLLQAAIDLSSAKHISLADASGLVTKAYEGNTRGLKSLGVEVGKGAKGMSAIKDIMDSTKGAADALADTDSGKLAASQQTVQESMVRVGAVISNISTVVIPILADAFSNLVDWVSSVISANQPLITAIGTTLGDAMNFISKTVIPALGAAMVWVTKTVGPPLAAIFDVLSKTVLPVLGKAIEAIGPIFKALQPVFQVVGNVINAIFVGIGVAANVLKVVIQTMGVIIGTVANGIGAAFSAIGTVVSQVFGAIGGIIKGAIDGVISIINGIIGAIDAIQVHIHVGPVDLDWNGLNIRKLPYLHAGGTVPGFPGQDVLAVLQAGETVIPANGHGMGGAMHVTHNVNIHIENFTGSDADIDALAKKLSNRLRLQNVSA